MIRTGFCSVTFRNLSIDEVIKIALDSGADGIEWGGDVHVPDVETAEDVYKKMESCGLKCLSYGSYYHCDGDLAEMERIAAIAKALHTKNIRVWAGEKSPDSTNAEERKAIVKNLVAFCKIAAQNGINISLEYHRVTLTENIGSALALIEETACDNLKCQWQINPDISFDENFEEIKQLCTVKDHLGNIHVFNMKRDYSFEMLSDIRKEWERYYKMILGAGEERAYILEFCKDCSLENFYKDMKTLKSIVCV